MGGLQSWPTSHEATSRTRNTCCGRRGSVSCTLTAARGHQPSQHILLCRSRCICLHSCCECDFCGRLTSLSAAALADCANSSASTAARAANNASFDALRAPAPARSKVPSEKVVTLPHQVNRAVSSIMHVGSRCHTTSIGLHVALSVTLQDRVTLSHYIYRLTRCLVCHTTSQDHVVTLHRLTRCLSPTRRTTLGTYTTVICAVSSY